MNLFSRMRFKYKVVILNENTLEEKFHTRISMLALIAWTSLFTLISFALLSAIILLTPLKYMLPGYAEMSIREDVINEALYVDSLSSQIKRTEQQMLMLKNVIAGNIPSDSISAYDTLTIEQLKQMPLGPTKQEEYFTEQYEDANIYNINDYVPSEVKPEEIVFVVPVHGSIQRHYNNSFRQYGITILTTPDKPVLAAHNGKIIYASDHLDNNTIIISNADEYTTIYTNLGRLLHTTGDKVSAGEAIAFVGSENNDDKLNNTIGFELWYKGDPIDPEKYIIF